jgi:hypothetical protein
LAILRSKLEYDASLKSRTSHSVNTIMELVTLRTTNTYFQFNNTYYKQVNGMAMGSTMSLVLYNLFMEDLEKKAIETFVVKPHIMLRYVDDTYVEWPEDKVQIEEFHKHLNEQSPCIKFTFERGENMTLPYFDVKLTGKNVKLETEVYRKATGPGLYLQFNSNHPKLVKMELFTRYYIGQNRTSRQNRH